TDAGYNCHLIWRGSRESAFNDERRVSAPLLIGEAIRSYTLALDSGESDEWAGLISGICFLLSGMPHNAAIESIELAWERRVGPRRVSIDNDTHEAVPGMNRLWECDVTGPANGGFSVYLGVADSAESPRSDGVRFVATL